MNKSSSTIEQALQPAPICSASNSVLVIVDIQEKLAAAMPAKVINRILRNTVLLSKAAALVGVPVLVTTQYPKGLGPVLPEISTTLPKDAAVLEKTCFSCWGAEQFPERLAGLRRAQIIVVGMEAHVCVLQTAFDLAAEGFQIMVVEDAICSRKLENYENALRRLQHGGLTTVATESVLFEWLRGAEHPHFKTVSGWLKEG